MSAGHQTAFSWPVFSKEDPFLWFLVSRDFSLWQVLVAVLNLGLHNSCLCTLWSLTGTYLRLLTFNSWHINGRTLICLLINLSCCRPQLSPGNGEASLSSSSQSVRDVFRQRYSVTWHPRLLYLIVSDGYMATVMRVVGKPSPALLLNDLLKNTTQHLEKASEILEKSQVMNQTFVGFALTTCMNKFNVQILIIFRVVWGLGWTLYHAWVLEKALRNSSQKPQIQSSQQPQTDPICHFSWRTRGHYMLQRSFLKKYKWVGC